MNNSKHNKPDRWEISTELTARSIPRPNQALLNRVLEDRFTIGFLAGIISYFPQLIWLVLSKLVGFTNLVYSDFGAIMVYGRFPQTIYEYIFAELVVVFWHGFVGVLFAFLLLVINSKNLLLKSWFFGTLIWFSSYVITYLFQVPELAEISLNTSLSNVIGATLQGIFMGYTFSYLEKE